VLAAARTIHARLELFVVELFDGVPVEAENARTCRGARDAARADAGGARCGSVTAPELQLLS
jgi:hypothetical protein